MKELFPRDVVGLAVDRLRFYEKEAVSMHPDGYYVADGGGKDSDCVVELAKLAGVRFTSHFNPTTVDPPQLLRHLRTTRPQTVWSHPRTTMWRLIEKKMRPPTRIVRYCCRELKERHGRGRFVVTGVRWAESVRRRSRPMVESCYRGQDIRYLHPIIDWSDADVWSFHAKQELPHCCLYDEGFHRIGCIGCPMAGKADREREFSRWPYYKTLYLRAFGKAVEERFRRGLVTDRKELKWDSAEAMWEWWMNEDRRVKHPTGPELPFGEPPSPFPQPDWMAVVEDADGNRVPELERELEDAIGVYE